ncbi:hypothetical protein B0J14DRAFT_560025 [Halenospora varia]|nr:hypothetical protein B0J14DRAFT_560025 [Halenospora varia]
MPINLGSQSICQRLDVKPPEYMGVKGGRAVSLPSNADRQLRYIAVSTSTLVISHVWIHGQGGRPETGMNSCLHERYSSITKVAGSDSYWIDTACIPSDHILRKDAILEIYTTFMVGKLTLVCDKDLMAIDISNLDLAKQELIFATLLMCDWNLRAWTMLQAFKGVLCLALLYTRCLLWGPSVPESFWLSPPSDFLPTLLVSACSPDSSWLFRPAHGDLGVRLCGPSFPSGFELCADGKARVLEENVKSNIEYTIFPIITSRQLYFIAQFWTKYNIKQYGGLIKAVVS